jgi:hypothetical protein
MPLAVVSFPGASMLMDASTRKPLDSIRGVLYFVQNRFAYELHAGLNEGALGAGRQPPNADDLTRRAERLLPEFYRTIAFK